MSTVTKVHRGRTRSIQLQVLKWRKRMKRFRSLKKDISLLLLKKGFDKAQTQAWLKTPQAELKGKTPRQLLNPINIRRLHTWANKVLR
jgi:hypothetical protein